jgi:FtsP/CotA-like multicopper oxidase with cupredoxin domain
MTISRRSLLRGATTAAAAFLSQPRLFALETGRFANPLKIPSLLEGAPGVDSKTYELNVAAAKSEFFAGLSTQTIGINGPYLGPTIRCRAGNRVALHVKNTLAEPTTLHWHGLHLPARSDGGPHQVVEPGRFGSRRLKSNRRPRCAGITRICWGGRANKCCGGSRASF